MTLACSVVELPGTAPALENALNSRTAGRENTCGNAGVVDGVNSHKDFKAGRRWRREPPVAPW